MTKCWNCSKENQDGVIFCANCRANIMKAQNNLGSAPIENLLKHKILRGGTVLAEKYVIKKVVSATETENIYQAEILSHEQEKPPPFLLIREKVKSGESILPKNPFAEESEILKKIEHRSIIRFHETFAQGEYWYIVTDYPEEKSLEEFIQSSGKLSEEVVLDYGLQLCEIIRHIHGKGVLHLDIQPKNIYIAPSGKIKVGGFHRVKQVDENLEDNLVTDGFSPPEQYGMGNGKVDFRSDIYSCGMTLLTLLSSKLPQELGLGIIGEQPQLGVICPSMALPLGTIIMKAIKNTPDQRYNTINEFSENILRYKTRKDFVVDVKSIAGWKTDLGNVRTSNEDSIFISEFSFTNLGNETKNGLYIVADGMGGESAGEIASRIACTTVSSEIMDLIKISDTSPNVGFSHEKVINSIKAAIVKTNDKIYELSQTNKGTSGMGSTIVVVVIINNQLYIGNVGDSRAYLITAKMIQQITKDHSAVARLVEMGKITKEEAMTHPEKNIIYRSLGLKQSPEVDTVNLSLFPGDNILLCSDGLTNVLSDEEIMKLVLQDDNPHEVCNSLIRLANGKGADDNVSVILIRIEPTGTMVS